MEIKTRNGFIYNAMIWVPPQIREQIKLAALHMEREALYIPTGTYRSWVLQRSWLCGGPQSYHHSKRWFTVCNWNEKNIEGSGNVLRLQPDKNATAKWLSECLSEQMTVTPRGSDAELCGQHLLALLQLLRLKEWLFYLIHVFPPVGRCAQQDLLIGKKVRGES